MMAGGGAAGKTTTTRKFALGEPLEIKEERMCELRNGPDIRNVIWTIYDNCAVAGNHKSGTDANTGPGLVKIAFYEALKAHEIAIVDGMVSSPRWATMCNEWQEENPDFHLEVILLYFKLDPETLMDRLASRRGEDKETFRERMWPKCVQLTRRAELLFEHFQNLCEVPVRYMYVKDDDTTDDIVALLDDGVCDYFQDCED